MIIGTGFFIVDIDTSDDYLSLDETGERSKFNWVEGASFETYKNRNHIGVIIQCPHDITTLKEGDKVWVKHFATDEDFELMQGGKTFYRVPFQSIYAYEREGKITTLHDFVFVIPTGNEEATVRYTPENCFVSEGEKVLIHPSGKYPLFINGEELWRCRQISIICSLSDTYAKYKPTDWVNQYNTMERLKKVIK